MTAVAYNRGHAIEYVFGTWVYVDTNEIQNDHRPCKKCGQQPTEAGYDKCLGHIEGASSVCCGHGVEAPYVVIEDAV